MHLNRANRRAPLMAVNVTTFTNARSTWLEPVHENCQTKQVIIQSRIRDILIQLLPIEHVRHYCLVLNWTSFHAHINPCLVEMTKTAVEGSVQLVIDTQNYHGLSDLQLGGVEKGL